MKSDEKILVMSDADIRHWLHRQVWLRPGETLALLVAWSGIRQYARVNIQPEKACNAVNLVYSVLL